MKLDGVYDDGRHFGQTNRGVNNRLGPTGPEYPPEWDRPEPREAVMTEAEAEKWREEHQAKMVTCPQCGERPTGHPDLPCQECRDSDLELAGYYARGEDPDLTEETT